MARVPDYSDQPLVRLQKHIYQIAFMEARRLRVCVQHHQWSVLEHGGPECPYCGAKASRAYRNFLLRAGRRGGKTRIGALGLIEELTIPNVWWWACSPTYPELKDVVIPAFFAQLPREWAEHPRTDWSASDLTLKLPNGSICQFRSLDDPERSRGPGLDGAWIDEVCKLTRYHLDVLTPALADKEGILLLTTTPKGRDFVHEDYWEKYEDGVPGYWATTYRSIDNPFMTAEKVAPYKASMSETMYRQEFEADIVTFLGAIYGEYVTPCIIEGTDEEMKWYFSEWPAIDVMRPSIAGLDPGTDHPFAFTQLVGSPRALVCIGEHEERQKPYQHHVHKIRGVTRGLVSKCGIDRSQAQAQIELAQYAFYTVPAENDVSAGINRVTAWMMKTRLDPTSKLPVKGLVLPKRYCPKLIKRLQNYRWADSEKKDGSTKANELVYKRDDDLPDALRYALMTYPILPTADPEWVAGSIRDISLLPDHVQNDIARLRRYDKAAREDHAALERDGGGMGDFFGSSQEGGDW